ncbi:hypothetical protein B0H63DRAFT_528556 [Podospora didyma]|uniref:Uncharacterized protein n=1 Tax=Podospora didyma TaxID=330526 RepID=A0AAE0K199_9PEZI|nr:hypothetical protein B0H63DRAFT_528556 [Podospora didyma]
MDHFNSTVKDGKLVNTRRGLQVSRQKFNGLSFVNSHPQNITPDSGSSTTLDPARASQRQVKFVGKGNESRPGSSKAPKQDFEPLEFTFASDVTQKKKPRRKATPKDHQLLTTPSGPSSRRSSRGSSHASSPGDCPYPMLPSMITQGSSQSEPGLDGTTSGPSDWSTNDVSEENWKQFHHYFAHIPHKIYPYEDILTYNPARGSDFYYMVAKDSAAVHCVLMSGTIAEAVVNSETDPKGFAYHISKICAILNRKLDQKQAVDPVTLHCIATLAAMGCYVSRLDHWHMHMRGLQKVLDVNGGLGGLQPALLAKMHKADLKGSAALASSPYLPFSRNYGSIFPSILSADVRDHTLGSLTAILDPLHVHSTVTEALSSLSLLSSSIRLARQSSGTVVFDPHAFTEEYLAIMHALLTQPAPLRNAHAYSSNPYSNPPDATDSSGGSGTTTRTENYMANHRLKPSIPVTPAEYGPAGPIEPALRIAGLLFLKELLPDWPRNLGGYAVLLSLLRDHITEFRRIYVTSVWQGQGNSQRGSRGRRSREEIDPNLLDPLLRAEENNRSNRGSYTEDALKSMKPLITWLCLVGNLVSLVADENECRNHLDDQYPRAVYRDCLRDLTGLCGGGYDDIQEWTGDDHTGVMLRLFDLRIIRGDGWDDADALKGLLEEGF